jgi:hypothetical protein
MEGESVLALTLWLLRPEGGVSGRMVQVVEIWSQAFFIDFRKI